LSRDHPVTATTSSSSRDRSDLEEVRYVLAYFTVISVRVAIDNPRSMPFSVPAKRAITYEARPSLHRHYF
jgi:hypothetical protein